MLNISNLTICFFDYLFFEQVARLGRHAAVERFYIQNDTHFNAEGNRMLFEAIDAGLEP
jgi:hypothetical protein